MLVLKALFAFTLLFVACGQPAPQEVPKTDIDVERILKENRLAQEKHARAMAEMRALMDSAKRAEAELAQGLAEADARRLARPVDTPRSIREEPPTEEGSINDPVWRRAQDAQFEAARLREGADDIWNYLARSGDELSVEQRATMTQLAQRLDRLADEQAKVANAQ